MTTAHPPTRSRAPKHPFAVLLALLGILASSTVSATVVFVKWDKPHKNGSRANVVALDLGGRKILWQAAPGKVVNFVVETKTGILVGTDEGTVVMLNPADGSVLWKTFLEKAEVTGYLGETLEGFLVSSGDERFWLVDHTGRLIMRCADQCGDPAFR
jgi:outer membrane protein assembly factor BamB